MLTGCFISVFPLLTNNLFTKIAQKAKNAYSASSERYAGVLQEILKGYEVIRTNNEVSFIQDRFDKYSVEKRKAASHNSLVSNVGMQVFYTMANLTTIVGVGVGAYLVIRGKMSAVMMLAAESYFATLSNSVSNIVAYVVEMRATKDIRAKLEVEATAPVKEDVHQILEPVVEYRNVRFAFGDRVLFQNFNCTFQPQKTYAITGESGSGKSTLMKLLLKYYDDYSGTISLGGQDIRQLSENNLFDDISVVDQSAYLFNASLYENITMFSGYPAKDSAAYRKLLEDVKLTALAEQVGDQPLGDFGEKISGGERQRINIARSLRLQKPILILDEPTTGLDPDNTDSINDIIFHYTSATRIVITHDRRTEYLARFDQVIQVDG
jgi:ATP-binding cassette subfamily C protein